MIIAIVQDGPVYNNKPQTLEKTKDILLDANGANADLVVFGESWFSGYPAWLDICPNAGLWDHAPVKEVWAAMWNSAIDLKNDDLKEIRNLAKEYNTWIVCGMNEKITKGPGNGTLYNTAITISNQGQVVNHHRKLMPTYTEKLVHGIGDGSGLNSVKTGFGYLGSLICWEHWMPLTRQAMHLEAEDIHIALWPYVKEMHQVCSRQYAHEGRCHVVSVGQIMKAREIPPQLEKPQDLSLDSLILKGGSCIYGPDGTIILDPVIGERKLILQELDLSTNQKERMNLSVTGHYNRPDVFDFNINKSRES